jgi:hypothetical protein
MQTEHSTESQTNNKGQITQTKTMQTQLEHITINTIKINKKYSYYTLNSKSSVIMADVASEFSRTAPKKEE